MRVRGRLAVVLVMCRQGDAGYADENGVVTVRSTNDDSWTSGVSEPMGGLYVGLYETVSCPALIVYNGVIRLLWSRFARGHSA